MLKSNLGLINKAIRILLAPSRFSNKKMDDNFAVGLVTSLLGLVIWTNLRPLIGW